MRAILVVFAVAGCHGGNVENLRLNWQDADVHLQVSSTVQQALANVPLSLAVRDVRPDPSVVGRVEEDGFLVRTSDNVALYASNQLGNMFQIAGAHFVPQGQAALAIDLVNYHVDEGGSFNGAVTLHVVVRRAAMQDWQRDYTGASHRWGRTHNPDNYNEALSNALSDATQQLLKDDSFGLAIMAPPGTMAPPAPMAAPMPAPQPSPAPMAPGARS
ncbi:MAG: YajG family lipoprotein [Deltaproteobacteria bacterium]